MSKASKDGECFYGLGDKATKMNLKGKRLENFATDQYAFQKIKPLYKVVPFIGLQNKQSYGIFFDNTFRPILILSRTKKRNELLGRRRNELLFHLWTSNARCSNNVY
jgi:alpha-glucosidase (family GH31 glycosyl hydrolase)